MGLPARSHSSSPGRRPDSKKGGFPLCANLLCTLSHVSSLEGEKERVRLNFGTKVLEDSQVDFSRAASPRPQELAHSSATVTGTSSPMSGNSAKHLLLGEIFLYLSKFLNLAPWQSYSITTDSRVDQPTDGKTRKPVISADLSSLVQLNIRTSRLKLNTRVAFWARNSLN
ncbi:hypothetical protein BJV77DRAFT_132705 [Russula vinacea]|nr:hypothetical protein BJV77DRAFT_132705 [Russula vinacea]